METTLQDAIQRCRENGGNIWRKDDTENNYVFNKAHLDGSYRFSAIDVLAVWVYEPPKKSAFQKWNRETGTEPGYNVTSERKKGWNAAMEKAYEVIQKETYGGRIVNNESFITLTPAIFEKIKNLKEP